MLNRRFSALSGLGSKKNIVSIIMVSNALIWYYAILSCLVSIEPSILVWITHFSALILSALAGASFGKQLERPKFLMVWLIAGVVASTMLFALNSQSEILVNLIALFLGISLGFGMPACMSFFSDSTAVEGRGRVSGLIMLSTGLGLVAFNFALESGLFWTGIILGVWRLSSLLVFLLAKDCAKIERKESESSYIQVFRKRSFLFYFVPWVMFSAVNYLAAPSGLKSAEDPFLRIVQSVFMGSFAVIGGFFVDTVGRKRIAIAGFALLGVGTAVLGLSGNSVEQIPLVSLYFNSIVDGIAWGFLLVLFVLTLWGDLSHNSSSDKYYALGVMPFFVSKLIELMMDELMPIGPMTSTALFSFTAFFLFLAVLPLAYAPETLPEKAMKQRELKIYVEKAQEIAQKYY